METFLRQNAPDVFGEAIESLAGRSKKEEVDRSARRIEALIGGEEIDLATLVLDRAVEDYPGQPTLEGYRTRLVEIKLQRESSKNREERAIHLNEILTKLRDLEQSGGVREARELTESAILQFPKVPALRIALASLQREQR